MNVLVTVASKHGSTSQIGRAIAETLRAEGHAVDLLGPAAVREIGPYDAVVLGSGIYAGRWIGSAKQFAEQHAEELRARPVWLFSSGPLGESPKPETDPPDTTKLVELLQPREHRSFAGALARSEMGFAERTIISMVKAPYGDFRDWDAIAAWAHEIASQLSELSNPALERIPA